MQPSVSSHPAHTMNRQTMREASSAPSALPVHNGGNAAELALRLAQRAFAAFIDDTARRWSHATAFGDAQVRALARRTLSALSADDRSRLQRWLIVQCAARAGAEGALVGRWLKRVDPSIGATVVAAVPGMHAQLHCHTHVGTAA